MTKQQILASIKEENAILKHLFSKVKPEQLSFSPGENMRTTEALLRYITYCAVATINWYDVFLMKRDKENTFQKYVDKADAMDIQKFPEALDEQYTEVEQILSNYSEEDLLKKKVNRIAGNECSLEEAIVNSSLRYLTAYRMQLFLYIKQNGQADIGTYNCWVGMDKPPKKPA